MSISKRIAIALFAATTSLFSLAPIAMAGEGGAAAAVSFSANPLGQVTGGAAAAAVGKQDAAAAATNRQGGFFQPTTNTASALGSAGTIEMTTRPSGRVRMQGSPDPSLNIRQRNRLNSDGVYGEVLEEAIEH
ncbi:MAG: hypothetical protein RMX68_004800 [Aulosira sp. ZfuVER01]|nr:hypothetical protein [Aulosira sp. ZfuVER01]MDZ8000727.1 hypothetical protein [Aulosira sp. DedVER01a]MDZ8051842.1 hypothetical protein [Aulosira sp. ZfuCHP01]